MIIGLLAAVVVLVAGGVTAAFLVIRANSPASAKVGDCLSFDRTRVELRRADCSVATHRLLGFADSDLACADVPGATQAVPGEQRSYCLAKVDADPTKAVNTVQAGDCVTVTQDVAEKSGCGSKSYPVIAVLRNVVRASKDDFQYKCGDVKGTENAYGWSIAADPDIPVGTWNRILCLGPQK